jgi:hypothetical protein
MKVLFLCGGIGKRMFPLTEDKFLLKFLGKTIIEKLQFPIFAPPGMLGEFEPLRLVAHYFGQDNFGLRYLLFDR